jgi:acetyl-CoA C-acetyltransferase
MACPSGMRAVALASQSIRLGEAEVVGVGGFDSMSSIPYLLKGARWDGFKMGNKTLEDGWSDSIDPLIGQGMGDTAENLYDKYKIPRLEQDEFAVSSHLKASAAQKNGWVNEEIVPIEIPGIGKNPPSIFDKDETIRHDVNIEKMGVIKPAFRKDGTVTAGNACGLSDGATAMIVTSRKKAKELGAKPLFSIVAYAQTAVDPSTMGEGPAFSIPLVLKKSGMTLNDMDIIEVNEAFAIQVLANEKILKWDREKLNVHGGAIALGHPTGISGARILVTGYYALKRLDKTFCVAGICGGGGVTTAMVIKRES